MTNSLLSIEQLSRDTRNRLFRRARQMESGNIDRDIARGKILVPLFFEPSTRTRLSFETAMLRLGGQVLPIPAIEELSTSKGESLRDTIRVVSAFGDLLIMRHPDEEALYLADEYATIPVINAGNGCDEHPTQTLLDLYTIEKEKGMIDGLKIGLVGDLKHARTMHSLVKGLASYQVTLFLISPAELRLSEPLRTLLIQQNISSVETAHLSEVLGELDVIYIVMLQHHRIPDPAMVERLEREYYCLNPDILQHAKPEMIILHPLVRRDEVASEVDALPHAAYFRQARNGVVVRMALIEHILRGES